MAFFEFRDISWQGEYITKMQNCSGFQGGDCSNCDLLGYFLNFHSSAPEVTEACSSQNPSTKLYGATTQKTVNSLRCQNALSLIIEGHFLTDMFN
jgi:hypothetical protein